MRSRENGLGVVTRQSVLFVQEIQQIDGALRAVHGDDYGALVGTRHGLNNAAENTNGWRRF